MQTGGTGELTEGRLKFAIIEPAAQRNLHAIEVQLTRKVTSLPTKRPQTLYSTAELRIVFEHGDIAPV
jgi:hypothetical protein